jgi:excisionase family DNA binding protein
MKAHRLSKPAYYLHKRLYSMKEAADYLGRSPWTVAEMVRTGKLPYISDGKRKFLDIQDINHWIETNKRQDID